MGVTNHLLTGMILQVQAYDLIVIPLHLDLLAMRERGGRGPSNPVTLIVGLNFVSLYS